MRGRRVRDPVLPAGDVRPAQRSRVLLSPCRAPCCSAPCPDTRGLPPLAGLPLRVPPVVLPLASLTGVPWTLHVSQDFLLIFQMARTKQTASRHRVREPRVTFTLQQRLNAVAAYRDFHNVAVVDLRYVKYSAMGFGGWAHDFILIVRKTLVLSPLFRCLPGDLVECIIGHLQESLPLDSDCSSL